MDLQRQKDFNPMTGLPTRSRSAIICRRVLVECKKHIDTASMITQYSYEIIASLLLFTLPMLYYLQLTSADGVNFRHMVTTDSEPLYLRPLFQPQQIQQHLISTNLLLYHSAHTFLLRLDDKQQKQHAETLV